jgi:hypothetical protein
VLVLLAIPLTWRRVVLIVAALAGFVMLFPLPAVRSFYALDMPASQLGITLLAAGSGAAALVGLGVVSRRGSRRPSRAAGE